MREVESSLRKGNKESMQEYGNLINKNIQKLFEEFLQAGHFSSHII